MSAGRTYFNTLNSATVESLLATGLAVFSNQKPDTYGFGMILQGFTPGFVLRASLTSQTTHVEALPGRIFAVLDEAGTTGLLIVYVGSPGAGEVKITYSDGSAGQKGTPTLEFNGAVTGYRVDKHELPPGFDEVFDAIQV